MSLLGKANFWANGHSQLQPLCCVIQSDMLDYLSFSGPFIFFCTIFHFSSASTWAVMSCTTEYISFSLSTSWCGYCYRCQSHWAFIFRVLYCPYQLVDPGQILYVRLVLPCKNFRQLPWCCVEWLCYGYVVRWLPCIWKNCTAKAYLWNQGGTISPFLSRLACQILSVTEKHSIILIPAYIPTHLNVEANYPSQEQLLPVWHLLPCVAQAAFQLWCLPKVGLLVSSHTMQCQQYYTMEN